MEINQLVFTTLFSQKKTVLGIFIA